MLNSKKIDRQKMCINFSIKSHLDFLYKGTSKYAFNEFQNDLFNHN